MESLLRFIEYYPRWEKGGKGTGSRRTVYADQVSL